MEKYQEEYLELLKRAARSTCPPAEEHSPDSFLEALSEANAASIEEIKRGTEILRENLFPLLDNILSASDEELESLNEFAGKLMSGVEQKDVGLHYRIHLALLSYARHSGLKEMLIRELYQTAMALYNLETMLSPNALRLFTVRMRVYFSEAASYFDSGDYDGITDAETRGYIHRSMGNIALSYDTSDPESAKEKLAAVTRSINILSDPDVRAKTPSLPWDVYLYKSHQERTSLLSFLRTGHANPDAFAQVLESAQTVQEHQLKQMRERGEMLQPRWQYAYLAARYHCGALLLEELLDALYSMSYSVDDEDSYGANALFSHVSVPALYMEYSKQLRNDRYAHKLPAAVHNMTKRMFAWIVRAPSSDSNEMLMFYLRQYLYTYTEYPGEIPFFDVLQNAFAARHPVTYARMFIAGKISRQLILWAVDDCPEKLVGLSDTKTAEDVVSRKEQLGELAEKAGRLYDTGMVHFVNLEASACRGLFTEEEAIIQLHAHCGAQLLSMHESTRIYADVAKGHHCRYDERGGYPTDFSPSASPVRALIYTVAAADALASCTKELSSRYRPEMPFEEVCASLEAESGKRYAPYVVALINSPERRGELRRRLETWRHEAYLDMYSRREKMAERGG